MKGKLSIFVVCVLTLLFHSCFFINTQTPLLVRASETSINADKELSDYIDGQLGQLDLEKLQEYVNSLSQFPHKDIIERLKEYIQGDSFHYEQFTETIIDVLFENLKLLLPVFACIMAISVLSGILIMLKSDSRANSATEMIYLICFIAMLIPLLSVLIEVFGKTIHAITTMQEQMQIIFPIMLLLLSASGGTVTAAICQPAVGFFATCILSILSQVVLPISVTIIAFSIAGHLTKDLKIGKFTAFFQSINKWIIGISVSVFGLFFTLQGLTAASYDGIMRRAAKYAIGNGVPIIGGFLSSGFDLAVAGSILIKNALGSLGIFLMLAIIFEPLISIITVNILLRFTSAVTQPLGDTRISDFLSSTADHLHYCTAGLLLAAFMYFLCILLMICCTEALL